MIYALDFDGVICDSAVETAITGWKAAQEIWGDMPSLLPEERLINDFRQVRPFLETGYESILIMRLLYQKVPVHTLCSNYETEIQSLIVTSKLETDRLKQTFGETRDHWIKTAKQEWLSMNPLFDGIAQRLKALQNSTWYIITTKQERFVKQIFQANDIQINEESIYGMERQQSKQAVLSQLQERHPKQKIIFVEDRLPTLIEVQGITALQGIHLQLVTWGYNTFADQAYCKKKHIELIGIGQFAVNDKTE